MQAAGLFTEETNAGNGLYAGRAGRKQISGNGYIYSTQANIGAFCAKKIPEQQKKFCLNTFLTIVLLNAVCAGNTAFCAKGNNMCVRETAVRAKDARARFIFRHGAESCERASLRCATAPFLST